MKKLLYLIFPIVLIGCDDGDIITNDFDFEDAGVELCAITPIIGQENDYVFYKNEDDNFETLALQIRTSDDILNEIAEHGSLIISSTSFNSFEYRKLDASPGNDYYCNDIPSSSPRVIDVFEATGGEIRINTVIRTDDDGDGVPSNEEGAIIVDGVIDRDATNHRDTDGDGIPDYLDSDDDGDNVPTKEEGRTLSSQGVVVAPNLLTDTDGDGDLDYLDNDDDGDGVLTINEDVNRDLNPLNDTPDLSTILPNYLVNNPNHEAVVPPINSYIEHEIQRTLQVSLMITNLLLTNDSEEIAFDTYDFGNYILTAQRVTCIPPFTSSDGCIFQ
jgi:hypothetical protein